MVDPIVMDQCIVIQDCVSPFQDEGIKSICLCAHWLPPTAIKISSLLILSNL